MFTLTETAFWSADVALERLNAALPVGWKLALREEAQYSIAELYDENGLQVWHSFNLDPKPLYLDGLGWLMLRSHKPLHPAWRPREYEVQLSVPAVQAHEPIPADLDPDEVLAVYKNRR